MSYIAGCLGSGLFTQQLNLCLDLLKAGENEYIFRIGNLRSETKTSHFEYGNIPFQGITVGVARLWVGLELQMERMATVVSSWEGKRWGSGV